MKLGEDDLSETSQSIPAFECLTASLADGGKEKQEGRAEEGAVSLGVVQTPY